jgi:3-oxoacyl-[acyl-carrier protein] reductase
MEKRVILITGSSRGIGANLIQNFAKSSYKVAINFSKSEKEATALYNEVAELNGTDSVLCIKADVGN